MNTAIKKYYYGDIPDGAADNNSEKKPATTEIDWPLWDVFIRTKQGLDHKQPGSLNKPEERIVT